MPNGPRQTSVQVLERSWKSSCGRTLPDFSGNRREISEQRSRVRDLKERLHAIDRREARQLELVADYLVPKSVWIIGGDGWAYDIGCGGSDHVLSVKHNVNILVLDTGVCSNTGGQASKGTQWRRSQIAAHGKDTNKKDLGLMAMSSGETFMWRA